MMIIYVQLMDDSCHEEEEAPPPGLLDRSPEMTGTRVRKQVERLTMNSPATATPGRNKNEIQAGRGEKLGTSPRILAQLQVCFSLLFPLHACIIFFSMMIGC